jgi:hypothetical protein
LAEAQLTTGETKPAMRELGRILADTAANGERFWDVELLRLRAAAARLQDPASPEAELDLIAARRLGEEQKARALLGRLNRDQEHAA